MGSSVLKNEKIRRELGRNLSAFLETLEMSESQLANRCKISQKQVNNITRARTGCGVDAIAEIASVLGCAPWMLLHPRLGDAIQSHRRLERLVDRYLGATESDQDLIEHVAAKTAK
jgi:plasmid maintenance system antidote protein VapI